jgi:hypothetical protein
MIKLADITFFLCIHWHIKSVYKEPPAVIPTVVFLFPQCPERSPKTAISTQIKAQTIAIQSLITV